MKGLFILFLAIANAEYFPNSVFVFGPEIEFDVNAFAAKHAPSLAEDDEAIMHWSGYYSINPQVVVTLMLEKDFLLEELEEKLEPFFAAYYNFMEEDEQSAATRALEAVLGEKGFDNFMATFQSLFPETSLDVPFKSIKGHSLEDDQVRMAFPYGVGASWFFNGIHTSSGGNTGPMSSIDMTRSWNLRWGDFTGNDFVTACHGGSVQRLSSCSVRVHHSTGWSTHYYHLDNVTVSTGQNIDTNGRISVYANTRAQALCNGGSSTGPHVHVSLIYNGNFYNMHNSHMSGFRLNAGRYSYDSSNAMYLERGGQRYYSYRTALRNDGSP